MGTSRSAGRSASADPGAGRFAVHAVSVGQHQRRVRRAGGGGADHKAHAAVQFHRAFHVGDLVLGGHVGAGDDAVDPAGIPGDAGAQRRGLGTAGAADHAGHRPPAAFADQRGAAGVHVARGDGAVPAAQAQLPVGRVGRRTRRERLHHGVGLPQPGGVAPVVFGVLAGHAPADEADGRVLRRPGRGDGYGLGPDRGPQVHQRQVPAPEALRAGRQAVVVVGLGDLAPGSGVQRPDPDLPALRDARLRPGRGGGAEGGPAFQPGPPARPGSGAGRARRRGAPGRRGGCRRCRDGRSAPGHGPRRRVRPRRFRPLVRRCRPGGGRPRGRRPGWGRGSSGCCWTGCGRRTVWASPRHCPCLVCAGQAGGGPGAGRSPAEPCAARGRARKITCWPARTARRCGCRVPAGTATTSRGSCRWLTVCRRCGACGVGRGASPAPWYADRGYGLRQLPPPSA